MAPEPKTSRQLSRHVNVCGDWRVCGQRDCGQPYSDLQHQGSHPLLSLAAIRTNCGLIRLSEFFGRIWTLSSGTHLPSASTMQPTPNVKRAFSPLSFHLLMQRAFAISGKKVMAIYPAIPSRQMQRSHLRICIFVAPLLSGPFFSAVAEKSCCEF